MQGLCKVQEEFWPFEKYMLHFKKIVHACYHKMLRENLLNSYSNIITLSDVNDIHCEVHNISLD